MSKQILAAVAVVAGLAAAYFFLTDAPPERETGASWSVPELEDFTGFALRRGDEGVSLEKRAAGWRITAPIDFAALARNVERVEGVFANAESRLLVDDEKEATPNNLTRYGFDASDAFGVTLYDGGAAVATFTVGQTEVAESGATRTWVRPEDGDRLYRLNNDLRAILDLDLSAWRDNELLALERSERDAISAIDLDYADRHVRLEKGADEAWTMVEPADVTLDPDLVTRWLRQVDRLRAADFADGVSLTEAGLEHPQHVVTLHLGEDRSYRLEFGAEFAATLDGDADRREQRRYARLDAGPVLVVSASDAARYMKRIGDFRPRDVLALERESITRIDLVDADRRIILVRGELPTDDDENSEASWRMQTTEVDDLTVEARALEPVDANKIRGLLTAASEVQALRFDDEIGVEAAGLTQPRRRIVVHLADDTEHVIAVGGAAEVIEAGQTEVDADHYARVDDSLVFVLRDFKVRDLLSTYADLTPDQVDENGDGEEGAGEEG